MKKLFSTPYLLAMLTVSTAALLPSSNALAAPTAVNVIESQSRITYKAIGYSQVERVWPRTGVVCRHNRTTKTRSCNHLSKGEAYKITDFFDKKKKTVSFQTFTFFDRPDFTCSVGSNGNLKNVRWGRSRTVGWWVSWERRKPNSYVQLQTGGSRPQIRYQGSANFSNRLPFDSGRFLLKDLTYGGSVNIRMSGNGCK